MSYKPEIDMDEAFDCVIENMKIQMIEHVLENHYDEVRDYVFEQEARSKQE